MTRLTVGATSVHETLRTFVSRGMTCGDDERKLGHEKEGNRKESRVS